MYAIFVLDLKILKWETKEESIPTVEVVTPAAD
jgi:hypothetical protein